MAVKWAYGIELESDYIVVEVNSDKLGLCLGDIVHFFKNASGGFDAEHGGSVICHMATRGFLPVFSPPYLHQAAEAAYVVARPEDADAILAGVPQADIYV